MRPGSPKKIFFDDARNPPKGDWLIARTVREFCLLFNQHQNNVSVVSLDHDIEFKSDGYNDSSLDGIHLARWMAEQNKMPKDAIFIHSSNPSGAERMEGILKDSTDVPVIRIDYMKLLERFNI